MHVVLRQEKACKLVFFLKACKLAFFLKACQLFFCTSFSGRTMYVYNMANELNDFRVDENLQLGKS